MLVLAHDRGSGALLLALSVALFPACGAGEAEVPRVNAIRDSAGVRIVENATPQWPDGRGWRIDPSPLVEIQGPGESGSDPLFEVAGALRLADGRIVVANGGANALYFFGPDGAFLSSVGAEGAGPGESRRMDALLPYRGDSLAVFDAAMQRLSVFSDEGQLGRTVRVDVPGPRPHMIGALADGPLVVGNSPFQPGTGVWRDSAVYVQVAANGERIDTLGRWPTEEMYSIQYDGRPVWGYRPFGRRTWAVAAGDALHVGTGDAYEIETYTSNGRLARLIRAAQRGAALGKEHIARYERERLEGSRGSRAYPVVEGVLASGKVPYPNRLPPHGSILAADDGGLWVQHVPLPGDQTIRWSVFNPEGRLLGTIAAPPDLQLLQVGPDFVLGLYRDDVGIESVRLHRLERTGALG